MGFSFAEIFGPEVGNKIDDATGTNQKTKKRWQQKAQKKINQYNMFIKGGLSLQEEILPRLTALEDTKQKTSASLLAQIYKDTIGPTSNELAATSAHSQRETDLADLQQFGGDWVRALMDAENADPDNAQRNQYEDELLTEAMRQFGMGSEMAPEDLRRVQQSVRANRASAGFGNGENDVFQEAVSLATSGEGLRRSRMEDAAGLLRAFRRPPVDVAQAVLGKPAVALGFAQGAAGQSNSRLSPYNAMEPTYGSDLLNAYYSDLYSKRNKAAADKAANYQLYGAAIGAVGNVAGGALALCWVAREVFGEQDTRWMLFREWLLARSPDWFLRWYVHHGEAFALWLHDKPKVKAVIRVWMVGRIKSYIRWARRLVKKKG